MLLERLFRNLAVTVESFSTCRVAPGWRLCLPSVDWVTLHFVLEGEGAVRDREGNRQPLSRHSLAVVPRRLVHLLECGEEPQAEVPIGNGRAVDAPLPEHAAGPLEEVELNVVCGRIEAAYGASFGVFDNLGEILVMDASDHPRMRELFETLLSELADPGPGTDVILSALMSECLVHLFRRVCSDEEHAPPWLSALEDPELAPVVDTVLSHPGRSHTVESLASVADMSRSVFARRFHESFGTTPMAFVREVRLRRGAELLRREPPLSVEQVANRVGFASRSHFTRLFEKAFGPSPREFRAGAAVNGKMEV